MGYSRDWGKLIEEKNLKLTILCRTTFKMIILFIMYATTSSNNNAWTYRFLKIQKITVMASPVPPPPHHTINSG
jgi:hypothetical protein